MNIQTNERLERAREEAYDTPLHQINVSNPALFEQDVHWPYFERLRREDPVHHCVESDYGPFWSITKYHDIKHVDISHDQFSSDGSIVIDDQEDDFMMPMFIAMDPPKHDQQRKVTAPVVAPSNLAKLQSTIRERVCGILDSLPRGETFNWVDLVSIELTTQMLATLFDFPFEERGKLTRWSDVATSAPGSGIVASKEQRRTELLECLAYFTELWNERVNQEPGNDFVSMLVHGESTRNMQPMEYLGNLLLLIVGGNDTTRNSISGGVLALNQFPDEYQKLHDDPQLITNMVPEIIRWQTPLMHMRRTALTDADVDGKMIREGDKVVMWYVSGNRDDEVIENPDAFIIDRPGARHHLSFGFGIHRCMGNRLAEMQLRILWEEIMERFHTIEVVGEPVRMLSNFVRGYKELPVRIST